MALALDQFEPTVGHYLEGAVRRHLVEPDPDHDASAGELMAPFNDGWED